MARRRKIAGSGEETVLIKAQDASSSLRTTVPQGIVNQFELKEGDRLNWKIKVNPENLWLFLVVEKVGDKNEEHQ